MTQRIRRSRQFEISLRLDDDFIRPPRDAQRNWVLNRAIKEFSDELQHLDSATRQFVPGNDELGPTDKAQGRLQAQEIMEDWQIPIMAAMAEIVGAGEGDVLEIGFGRGIASDFVQQHKLKSHTIVECNDAIVADFHEWRKQYAGRDIRLLHGRWQDLVDQMENYDAILFHTYPLDEREFVSQVVHSETFADNFFPVAARLLREHGLFTYLTNEIDSLSRGHQRALWQSFSSFRLSRIENLAVPPDTKDAMWADSMVVIEVHK